MPYAAPLTGRAVAMFLALPPEERTWVIMQGPLRPPSCTPFRTGPEDTLLHRIRDCPRLATDGTAGAPGSESGGLIWRHKFPHSARREERKGRYDMDRRAVE